MIENGEKMYVWSQWAVRPLICYDRLCNALDYHASLESICQLDAFFLCIRLRLVGVFFCLPPADCIPIPSPTDRPVVSHPQSDIFFDCPFIDSLATGIVSYIGLFFSVWISVGLFAYRRLLCTIFHNPYQRLMYAPESISNCSASHVCVIDVSIFIDLLEATFRLWYFIYKTTFLVNVWNVDNQFSVRLKIGCIWEKRWQIVGCESFRKA